MSLLVAIILFFYGQKAEIKTSKCQKPMRDVTVTPSSSYICVHSFIQATDSNVFIASVMTPLYYWPVFFIHHILNDADVLAPSDCIDANSNVHLTCEEKDLAWNQFVLENRGRMEKCCHLKSMCDNTLFMLLCLW